MTNSKDQYFRIVLLIIILVLGGIIFYQSLPFLGGFLGAFTMYILVRGQMIKLIEEKKMKPYLAATLILGEVVLCCIIPLFLGLWLLLSRVNAIDLEPTTLIDFIEKFVNSIQQKTSYNIVSSSNIETVTSVLTNVAQKLLDQVSSFIGNCVVLLFVLYFMLLGGRKMEVYIYDILPFSPNNKKEVVKSTELMIKSNAVGIPLLAIIQGVVGSIGYFIFKTPDPILFGFLTCFASIIPVIGTAIVWLPLCIYLFSIGEYSTGAGLLAYSLLVISNVDSIARFWLQKRMADTHPLITIFGVIMGLSLFGFWGVIFGPLLLSLFLLCFDLYKREYLDS